MTNEVTGVQDVSNEPHEAFPPHIWSYVHGTGVGAEDTEEGNTHADTPSCTLSRYLCSHLIHGLRSNIINNL